MTQRTDLNVSVSTPPVLDTSSSAQRARLLARLQAGPIDTITARSELNIFHPAARVQELRDVGHSIGTHRVTLTDDQGRKHSGIALYYLGTEPTGRAAA